MPEVWIQLENRPWDTIPNNIDRLTGRIASLSPAAFATADRLWWKWYNSAAGNHQNPVIAGPLAPWTYTEPDTRNIINLGYDYE